MVTDVLTRLSEGCLSEEFDSQISLKVFAPLGSFPTHEQWGQAKIILQDLYHEYRKKNPCQISAFAHLHRCIYQVYCEAYDRLSSMQVRPSVPQRKHRVKKTPPPVSLSREEVLKSLQLLITGTSLGEVIDDEPFE